MAKLYFKYGAMGSSKTAQALITKYNYEENDMKVWLIKPSADTRDGADILRSRIGLEATVEVIAPNVDVYARFLGRHNHKCDVIIVDECQFMTEAQIDQLRTIVDEHNIRFSISFGPTLIKNGTLFTPRYYPIGENTGHYPRAALCQLGQCHYMVAIANSIPGYEKLPTLAKFGDCLLSKGITTAYTLDGGQTAVLAMNGEMINPVEYGSQRRISDIFYFATAVPDGG